MENHEEYMNQMTIKLKVLENRIRKLTSIADEVVNDLNSEYQKEINELVLKQELVEIVTQAGCIFIWKEF